MSKTTTHPLLPLFDTMEYLKETASQTEIEPTYQSEFLQAIQFLHSYRGSEATYNSYRRELERFLQWSWRIKQQSLTEHKRQDIESFVHFCQHPNAAWVGFKQVRRFVNSKGLRVANKEWRPFTVNATKMQHAKGTTLTLDDFSLSQKSLQAIFAVLSSFYNYLIQEDVMRYNPVAQIRQKSKFLRTTQTTRVIRRLTELQWAYVVETTEIMANNDANYERSLFIIHALFAMYLRVSELASNARWQPTMGDFFQDHDHNWWFRTVGKGNKERQISVSDDMLKALKRYRLHLGLSSVPAPGEQTPVLTKINHSSALSSTRQIRNLVQECFDESVERLIKDGFTDEANTLKSATVHWLRHTGISEDVKVRPREHVRDDAGHSTSAITDLYIDVELRERHASAKKKRIKPD